MVLILILSIALAGLSIGMLSNTFLKEKQRESRLSSLRDSLRVNHLFDETQNSFRKLPFIGPAIRKQEALKFAHRSEAELPRLFDILAMGIQSGLSFDAAFALYVRRFDTELALVCRKRFEIWERGLVSREESMAKLAESVNNPVFDSFCRTAIRSIRLGIPMAPLVKEYADQARKEYRNKQKELVLKAPVKMLLPTGGLILPAMMLLIIGPIVLDITERMV